MKNLKAHVMNTCLAVALSSAFVVDANAAAGTRGGGVAHVCRDASTNTIRSIEMLDIRRAKKEYGSTYDRFPESEKVVYARTLERLLSNPAAYARVGGMLEVFANKLVQVNWAKDGSLFWTGDGEPGEADAGCHFEQVGILQNNRIYVNKPLFDSMNALNQIDFWLHESVYYVAKHDSSAETSVESQHLVGLLLGDQASAGQIQQQVAITLPKIESSYGWRKDLPILINEQPIDLKLEITNLYTDAVTLAQRETTRPSVHLELVSANKSKSVETGFTRTPLESVFFHPKLASVVTKSFPIPFLPNGIFANASTAELSFHSECKNANCGTNSNVDVAIEISQGGILKAKWHSSGILENFMHLYDGITEPILLVKDPNGFKN